MTPIGQAHYFWELILWPVEESIQMRCRALGNEMRQAVGSLHQTMNPVRVSRNCVQSLGQAITQ